VDGEDNAPKRFLGLDEYDWQWIATHSIVSMPIAFAIMVLAATIANRAS
jgi:hypothetical protein